jgi:hypothetical protein
VATGTTIMLVVSHGSATEYQGNQTIAFDDVLSVASDFIVRGPLWSATRWRGILFMNLGWDDFMLDKYRRKLASGADVANP